MQHDPARRTVLRWVGGVAAVGLVAAPATAADCDATVYTNATEGGEPKLEVPSGAAEVTGESTCAAGTELAVAARSSGPDAYFAKQVVVTVGDRGGWTATFDFSAYSPGTTFQVEVSHEDGETLDGLDDCEVVEDAPTPHPTPSPTPTATPSPTASPSPTPTASPSPTPTASRTPTATPSATPSGPPGTTGTTTSAGAATDSADGAADTATETDAGNAGTATPSGTGAPGFGLAASVAGLAAAARWLRGDG